MDVIRFIESMYDDWLNHTQDLRSKQYKKLKNNFSASSSGSCYKQNIYKVLGAKKGKIKPINNRIMRLGTIQHDDLEKATKYMIEKHNKDNESEELKTDNLQFFIEEEILLPKYNLAGHLDIAILDRTTDHLIIIDYKTMNSRSWMFKFGTKYKIPQTNFRYEMQLSTYAMGMVDKINSIGYLNKVKSVDMYLLYINKDTSVWKLSQVDPKFIDETKEYWSEQLEMNELVDDLSLINEALPKDKLIGVPFEPWECQSKDGKTRYCSYVDICR